MSEPIKFDFSSYTAAIPAISAIREQEPPPRIAESQESQGPKAKNAASSPHQEAFPNRRIARIAEADRQKILAWLAHIGETDQAVIDDVLHYCASNPEALAYYLKRAGEVPPPDDRHHCRECLNLRNGYCIKQRVRPVDDLPRRCEDFMELSQYLSKA
ncbi:MAG: hypothetical protein ACXW00_09620 [Methylobacter sp.]